MRTWNCYDSTWHFVVVVSGYNEDDAWSKLSEDDRKIIRYMREQKL